MKRLLILLSLIPAIVFAQAKENANVWGTLNQLIGRWEGEGNGEPGVSKVEREYQSVLNAKFLRVKNKSTYKPQEKNPKGEVHEDVGFISYDRRRKLFVLRQFHIEGFVNQYTTDSMSVGGNKVVFMTESIENIAQGWRGRETYTIINENEFTEVFELAAPGKDFEVYTQARFKRVKE